MAAEGSALDAGAYVRIEGLQRGTQHNGRYGFVVGHEGERLVVVTAHSDVLLNIKPGNLIPEFQDRTSKTHEVVMVYPNAGGPTVTKPDAASMLVAAGESSPLSGWPVDWKAEMRFIRESLGWKQPVCVSGVTRGTNPRPDLMIYVDAASEHCLVNAHANAAIAKLPSYEYAKVKGELPGRVIRGPVILVYSPTVSMAMQQLVDDNLENVFESQMQPNAGKLSLDDAAVALAYQHTVSA
jgi:hypothetical protein